MKQYNVSLKSLLGKEYTDSAIETAVFCRGLSKQEAEDLVNEEITVCSKQQVDYLNSLLSKVGKQVVKPASFINFNGAPTDAFGKAAHNKCAPIGSIGPYRIGEDGKLYFAAKSEHYHTPLGHGMSAYKLLQNASKLGITNATHNNTRGYITRLAEYELIKHANGANDSEMNDILSSKNKHVLNRVINLETGSLACEAGMKMMLMRFYRLDKTYETPIYDGRIPVFFVMGDIGGGINANYHGTTVLAQTFRGMWPELYNKFESEEIYKVVPIMINDLDDFKSKLAQYDTGKYKVAGFIHEIVLMNYGGIRLTEEFLSQIYSLCNDHDIPTMCDEIQSCMWYKGMFLFRLYNINPDFVIIGKGFPGGNYAASKILTTAQMDKLNQFGALVTNGQEELASLSYLITMNYSDQNTDHISHICNYYEQGMHKLKDKYPHFIEKVEGKGLLSTIVFKDADTAIKLAAKMNEKAIDTSVQTYKAQCPPAVLTKPPIICTEEMIDFIVKSFDESIISISKEN